MTYHKSIALCVACLLPARLAVKVASKAPAALEGSAVEQMAGKLSHAAL
jgi:cytochrome b561